MDKTEAIEALQRAKGTIRRMREEGAKTARKARTVGEMAVGGAVSGLLQAKLPTIPGTDIDSGAAASALLAVVAATDMIGDEELSTFMLNVAGGMAACEVGELVHKHLATTR